MEHLLDYLDSRRGVETETTIETEYDDEEESEPQCDCGWANRRSCRHDDGTVCHYVCCPRHTSKKHMIRKRHKKKIKKHLTLVEELRAMLRTRQRHDGGVLTPFG